MVEKLSIFVTAGGFSGPLHPYADLDQTARIAERAEDADIAVFPFDTRVVVRNESALRRLQKLVRDNKFQNALGTVIFLDHDHPTRLAELFGPGSVTIRPSMLPGIQSEAEWACPALLNKAELKTMPPVIWASSPRVGFVGSANPATHYSLIRDQSMANVQAKGYSKVPENEKEVFPSPFDLGAILRKKILDVIERSNALDTRIVRRDLYFEHVDKTIRPKFHEDFIENLEWSHYVICVRGAGNFSIRLFEVLAAGRIPIILDSGMAMPCDDVIDWRDVGLWFSMRDLDTLAERIAEYHQSLGPAGLERRASKNREIWQNYLSLEGFRRYVTSRLVAESRRGDS